MHSGGCHKPLVQPGREGAGEAFFMGEIKWEEKKARLIRTKRAKQGAAKKHANAEAKNPLKDKQKQRKPKKVLGKGKSTPSKKSSTASNDSAQPSKKWVSLKQRTKMR
jgi:hypothetical protein